MKISALITTLVLGASSVAAAAPATSFDTSASYQRDHRYRPPVQPAWQKLATNERLMRGRDTVKLYTPIRASTLKLEASLGSMFVDKVIVTFSNGRSQVIELDKRLGRFAPVTIDLNGRQRMITKIEVLGRGSFRSAYNVLAA